MFATSWFSKTSLDLEEKQTEKKDIYNIGRPSLRSSQVRTNVGMGEKGVKVPEFFWVAGVRGSETRHDAIYSRLY